MPRSRHGIQITKSSNSAKSHLTTEANELMRPLHDRMPVILDPTAENLWLDPRSPADALRSLFVPFASERMEAFPVSAWVSNARNQGPKCLEPA
jgi:putative SOS response-associated peptidase YedK